MEKIFYSEDIVEYALTYGIKKAGKKFHINDDRVKSILSDFIKDVSVFNPCSCQRTYLETGHIVMCFMCDNPRGPWEISLSLNERLGKAGYYN